MTFPEELDMSVFIDVEDEVKCLVSEKSSTFLTFLIKKIKMSVEETHFNHIIHLHKKFFSHDSVLISMFKFLQVDFF